jgi:hypothetical protein
MSILGCEFVNEGQTMSIEDLLLENVTQFVARDIEPMRAVSSRKADPNGELRRNDLYKNTASDLLDTQEYKDYLDKIRRYNPFR